MKTLKILGIFLFLLMFSIGSFAQTLISPANGSTGVDRDLVVNWTLPAGTIAEIQIQASIGDPNFWAPQVDDNSIATTATSYTFSSLSIFTTYYWRVIVTYDDDSQTISPVWSFTVGDGTTTVNVPNLTIPVDEATWGIDTTPTLGWWYLANGTTPTYSIVVTDGTNPVSGSPFTTTNTSFEIPSSAGLVNGTEYFWIVTANGTDYSDEWSFTPTSAVTTTNKPNLSAPVNNATWGITTTPTLSWWYVASGTVTYTVTITNGSATVYSTTTTSTSFDVPASAGLVNGTTYYWTITADGQTSDEWNFTPNATSGGTAQLILNSPINGGIGKQPIRPTMSWRYEQASGTSFTYNLIVSDNSDLSAPIVNESITDDATIEYTLEIDLDYETVYYWAVNVDGGTYTDSWSFTTIDGASGGTPVFAVLDLEVTNDDSTAGLPPSLPYDVADGWEDVPGMIATGYTLQLDDITAGSGYYYLTLGSETLLTTSIQESSYYPYYLDTVPDGFAAYWTAKGINPEDPAPASGTMAEALWNVMNGFSPMFYIWMNGDGDYYLIDGFMHDFATTDTYFQINDDYPTGNYIVKGDLSSPNLAYDALTADSMTIDINFNDGTNSELSFSDVGDVTPVPYGSTNAVNVTLNLKNGFTFETSFFGKFIYDDSKLDFAYADYGSGTLINGGDWNISFYESLPGEISFIASVGTSPITTDGTLFKLYFSVIDNSDESCEITGTSSEIYVDGTASVLDILAGTVYYTTSSASSSLRGDANLDFEVTMDDAIAVLNHINNVSLLEGDGLANGAAADGVSGISLDDAMAILNYLATNSWNYSPSPLVVGESIELSDPKFIAEKLVSLPVEVSSDTEVKSVEVEFSYDPEDFDFQSFKAAKFGSGIYTTAKEVEKGKAVLTFLAQEPVKGTVNPGKISLSCINPEASSDITTKYKLNSAAEFKDGPSFSINSITGVENDILPNEFELLQNYPNPFNPTTMIQYSMPEAAFVSLRIYNLLGEEVKTLVTKEETAGVHNVQWNGTNNIGQKVTSGIYIYRIVAGNFVDSKKLVLLK